MFCIDLPTLKMKHDAAYFAITYWISFHNYLGTSANSILNDRLSDVFGILSMTIWRMRIACWIPKAIDTHSEYVILIDFPLQQWLHKRALMLLLYIYCLSCYCDITFLLWKVTIKLNFHDFRLPPRSRRELGFSGLSHSSQFFISIHEPCIFYYFVLWPTNTQLFHKLLHSCMFRHYRMNL
jgi:hypothetical protein